MRTALTALGVGWGIFMLVIMLGAGTGLENGTKHQFSKFANNMMGFWGMKTTKAYMGYKPGKRIRFNNDDIAALQRSVPEIEYLAPRAYLESQFQVKFGNEKGTFQVSGTTPDLAKILPVTIPQGRFINAKDETEKRKVAVVGEYARKLLCKNDENMVGNYISIKGVYFLVIGILKSARDGDDGQEDENAIYLPLSTLQQSFNQPNSIAWFLCNIKEAHNPDQAEEKIKATLRSLHQVHPEDNQAIGSFSLARESAEIQSVFTGIKLFTWIVGFGTILAGIIGVANIMLVVVKERTREIGIRKSLGATPNSIISMILQEAIVLTFAAGYIGLVLGIGLLALLDKFLRATQSESMFFRQPEVNMGFALSALVLLVVAGALAGFYPAWKAASVNPVEALSHE
ncbi:MAG: ABC transporter permease [Chitinophagales bacterium]